MAVLRSKYRTMPNHSYHHNFNRNHNLYAHFAAQYSTRRDAEVLRTDDGVRWTFDDLDHRSACMLSLMQSLGVLPGDRVSVQVEKTPQALCLYLACLRGGIVFHPLNPAYTINELRYFLGDATPSIVACSSARIEAISELSDIPVLTLDADGTGTLVARSADLAPQGTVVARARDDLAALLYSSGTTGLPKGVMLSCGNLLSNTQALVQAWACTRADCLMHALPIYHVHGLFVAIGCALLSGARMRWLSGFNTSAFIKNLPDCSVMMGVPTYYTRLLADSGFSRQVCTSMRLFISGSAPLREETFMEFEQRTGHQILERYGMTETNMNASNPLEGERRPGTVGLALPGVTLRAVDDDGHEVSLGEIGNLQVKGPNVFVGYWNKPEMTSSDFTNDGFFNTGDKAMISADGYVSIVGRAKDLVISGGLNVYPKEVESVLDTLPGVSESAVIGVPHPDFGEAVIAIVVPAPGAKLDEHGMISSMKAQLANYKLPKRIVMSEDLPRNAMAKVQKNVLREIYAEMYSEKRVNENQPPDREQ